MAQNLDQLQMEAISPVSPTTRPFSLWTYTLTMWSTLITIQAFVIGQTFLPPYGPLNLLQGLCVMIIGCLAIAVFMSLNGEAGLKYGIPFSIQLRASFGTRGSKLPQILRLIPGVIWYGIGTWIAALSMNGIIATVTGFTAPAAPYVYFIALQAVQTWLAYKGIQLIKWFNVGSSILLVATMGYMMFHVTRVHGLQFDKSWNTPGNWGLPFWVAVNSVIGVMAAVIANSSDLSRYIERDRRSLWWGNVLGVVPPLFFMVTLGVMASIATDEWNAVKALMAMSPNTSLMLLLLIFVLFAQFTTALVANILPVALIFEESLGVNWHKGVLLAGVLGALTFPWMIMESAERIVLFVSYYSCFFGPIAGVMIADYFLRSGSLNVDDLYAQREGGEYWFSSGINWAGIFATTIPAAITMIWALKVSWLVGLPLGFILYVAFYRLGIRRVSASVPAT
jgi:NCS1 family nucleobase:cation symporter-1